jgi:hypothetical protein
MTGSRALEISEVRSEDVERRIHSITPNAMTGLERSCRATTSVEASAAEGAEKEEGAAGEIRALLEGRSLHTGAVGATSWLHRLHAPDGLRPARGAPTILVDPLASLRFVRY